MWIVASLVGYHPDVKEFETYEEALKIYKEDCEFKDEDEKIYLAEVKRSEEGEEFCLDEHQ